MRVALALALAALLLSSAPTRADDLSASLDAAMSAAAGRDQFAGSVLVVKDGRQLLARGYGMADIELGVPNTPATKFRLGSITKQFTAMAILILQERGKLSVDDPIAKYLDNPPEAWKAITVRHLLTHTSGIANFTSFPDYRMRMREPTTVEAMIGRFRDRPLDFAAGERFAYSNSGYFLLGAIIEKASGSFYATLVREAIFEPLGMADSGYDDPRPILPNRASGYERLGKLVRNAEYLDMSQPYAAGSLYSTVLDLARWDAALREGKLVGPGSYKAMFTPFKGNYAFGWVVNERAGHTQIGHAGGINGFNTTIVRYPDDGLLVVVLSNLIPAAVDPIALELSGIVLGLPPEKAAGAKDAAVP